MLYLKLVIMYLQINSVTNSPKYAKTNTHKDIVYTHTYMYRFIENLHSFHSCRLGVNIYIVMSILSVGVRETLCSVF